MCLYIYIYIYIYSFKLCVVYKLYIYSSSVLDVCAIVFYLMYYQQQQLILTNKQYIIAIHQGFEYVLVVRFI